MSSGQLLRYSLGAFVCFVAFCTTAIDCSSADERPRPVELDVDHDGDAEKMAWFDRKGNRIRIEADLNNDGLIDLREKYRHGQVVSREWDSDHDGYLESRESIRDGKLLRRQVKHPGTGHVVREIIFGSSVRETVLHEMDPETGCVLSTHNYRQGVLLSSTRDRNRDGAVDLWQSCEDGSIRELRLDNNGDGKAERKIYFNSLGEVTREERVSPEDGSRLVLLIRNGEIETASYDRDGDGRVEERARYAAGRIVSRTIDENGDSRIDIRELYPDDAGTRQVEIYAGNAVHPVGIYLYDADDKLRRQGRDEDGNGVPDTWIYYEDNKPIRFDFDGNQNGVVEKEERYDQLGRLLARSRDLDEDGEMDITVQGEAVQ